MRLLLAAQSSHLRRNEIKKSYFHGQAFLGPSGGTKNETAKSQNQQQRPTRAGSGKNSQLRLVKQQAYRVGTSCPSGRHKPQSFIETKTLRFCNLDTNKLQKMNLNTVPKMGPPGGPIFGTACTA